MSNTSTPFGAQVFGAIGTADFNANIRKFVIPATDATAVFVGDFVKLTGTANPSGLAYVIQSAAADIGNWVGVVQGFEPNRDDLSQLYRPASQERVVYVNVNPYVEFNILTTNGTFAVTDVGQNANIAVAAGNTTTGVSGMSLDLATLTTSTAQVRITEVTQISNNAIGVNTIVRGFINQHAYKATTGV